MRKDDQIHSFNSTEYSEGNFSGLTKYEHMAIEFTKALISSRKNNLKDIDWQLRKDYCAIGISIADELIKQLNEEK